MRLRKMVLSGFLIVALLTLSVPVLADLPVVKTLDNGLTVVVQRLDRNPAVAVQVWVRAGSNLETDQTRGITHQIEHMIFKGTPTRALGRVAGQIEEAGGRINAYTSLDHTVYHTVLPSDSWALGLEVLADAINNSLFDEDELEKEKQVVLEEWRRAQDNPSRKLYYTLFERAFTKHPYRHPVIGYETTIAGFTRERIMEYMARWYTADRMTVVVVGKVDPDRVLARAESLFSQVARGPKAKYDPPLEPEQTAMRFTPLTGKVKRADIVFGFRIPGLESPDVPGYDLLAEVLGGSKAARLPKILWAQKGLVDSVGAFSFTLLDQGLFWLSLSTDPAKLDEAVSELWHQLNLAKDDLYTEEELARAKLSFEADTIREKQTVDGQASKLGLFQNLMGGVELEAAYMDRVKAQTGEDLRNLARRTFRPENLTAVLMLPENEDLPPDNWLAGLLPKHSSVQGTVAVAPPENGQVKKIELDGGLELLILEDHSLPLVAIQAYLDGGLLRERADQAGIFSLMASTWTRGAAKLPAEELDRRLGDMAGYIFASSGRNTCGLSGQFLSRFLDEGLELYVRTLLYPTFPEDEVAKRKADQLAAIKRKLEQPASAAFDLFRKNIYKGHPYQRDTLGTEQTVSALTSRDLADLHAATVRSDNLVVAVVGDVSADKIKAKLTRLLADLEPGYASKKLTETAQLPPDGLTDAEIRPELKQTHTLMGYRSPGLGDPDSVALDVLAGALSGMSGRLFMDMRDRKSLAYAVTAMNGPGIGMGTFAFYIASAPEKTAQVKSELKNQFQAILDSPLTEQEFTKARAQLLADWILDNQTMSAKANRLALYQRLGLGYDYETRYEQQLRRLTPEKVMEAARKRLNPEQPVWVTVGPE